MFPGSCLDFCTAKTHDSHLAVRAYYLVRSIKFTDVTGENSGLYAILSVFSLALSYYTLVYLHSL